MRVLILSYYFPPHAGMGAIRVGRLADFLSRAGHEVRVVAARGRGEGANGSLDPSVAGTLYTRWLDVNFAPDQVSRLKNWMLGRVRSPATSWAGEISHGSNSGHDDSAFRPHTLSSRLDRLYRLSLNIPDDKVGWLPSALWQGWRTARSFRPDVIYASSPPPTGLVAAAWLARRLSIPWVAEIRDRWADDPYDPMPRWRLALDRRLERRVLASARGIVTVSETWAQAYRERYGKPTAVIYNGFVPEDTERQPSTAPFGDRCSLRIVHTGAIYAGSRPDPAVPRAAAHGPGRRGHPGRVLRQLRCGNPGARP